MNNEVIQKNGFYISYNPNPGNGISTWSGDDGSDETAIVKSLKGKKVFYILNGDHRVEYKKCKTLRECMNYFKKNEHLKSSWSN